jgi:hypothetical protein
MEKIQNTTTWVPKNIRLLPARLNSNAIGKTINIVNKTTGQQLLVSTPLMSSFGISDYEDNKKYSIAFNFPREDDLLHSPQTELFLTKLKELETVLIDAVVERSEELFGETYSLDFIKNIFVPIVKYSKMKDSQKKDFNRPPSIRAKVTNYDNNWDKLEIYNDKSKIIFPNADIESNDSPLTLVPSRSEVAAVIHVSQIWTINKQWGCTFRLVHCLVCQKQEDVYGICPSALTSALGTATVDSDDDEENQVMIQMTKSNKKSKIETFDAAENDQGPGSATYIAVPVSVTAPASALAPKLKSEKETPASKTVVAKSVGNAKKEMVDDKSKTQAKDTKGQSTKPKSEDEDEDEGEEEDEDEEEEEEEEVVVAKPVRAPVPATKENKTTKRK